MVLIREAEHLMDYLFLISLEVCERKGTLAIGQDTPEPLFSILEGNRDRIDPFAASDFPRDHPSFGLLFASAGRFPWALEPV